MIRIPFSAEKQNKTPVHDALAGSHSHLGSRNSEALADKWVTAEHNQPMNGADSTGLHCYFIWKLYALKEPGGGREVRLQMPYKREHGAERSHLDKIRPGVFSGQLEK